MSVAALNDFMSNTETQAMLQQILAYCERTGSARENIYRISAVESNVIRKMSYGGLITVGQHEKLTRLMQRFPNGVTKDDFVRKSNKHDDIHNRLAEREAERLRYVEACKEAERDRYGQNYGDWTPVERMIA